MDDDALTLRGDEMVLRVYSEGARRFGVKLHGRALKARTSFAVDDAAAARFAAYFAALARDWRGWEGERAWTSSPREEPSLRARFERTGRTRVAARLGNAGRTADVWRAEVVLRVESGHLDALARAAAALAAPAAPST